MIRLVPATLESNGIRLEPMALAHCAGLEKAAADGRLWELFFTSVPGPGETEAYVQSALREQQAGTMLPWVVRDVAGGEIIGSTRYHDVIAAADRVEIGFTWYAQSRQRSHVNTTCKLMLFEYGFEKLGCKVIGLRTDNFNFRSQRAIEALGAKKDGVLRNHWPRRDGSVRDTVMYSVLAQEWPGVKLHLQYRLKKNEPKDKDPQ